MTRRTDNRYDARREEDGTWTVYDIFTGTATLWENRILHGLDADDADDLVDLMNSRNADARRSIP